MATTPIPARPPGEPPSVIQSAPNQLGFDPKQAVPQQPVYFQRNDQLLFVFMSNTAGMVVQIDYRWLTPDGQIKEGTFITAPFSIPTSFSFSLYEGWLLSFVAHALNAPVTGQWVFMQAILARVFPTNPGIPQKGMIWQGYLPQFEANGWPGTPTKEITDGAGTLVSITGSTPAAGAEIIETVPTQRRRSLLAIRFQLTTGAAVANRQTHIQIDDGANLLFSSTFTASQVASTVLVFSAGPGVTQQGDAGNFNMLTFPSGIQLKGGFRIKTITAGIQAADQYSAPQYLIQEWGQWDP